MALKLLFYLQETIDFVSTSKRPSEISMELTHPKNDPATVPQPGKDAKVLATVKRNFVFSSLVHLFFYFFFFLTPLLLMILLK